MYNWNFLFLVIFCVLNSIEADVGVVDGREYSCKRSLHFYPDTPSYDRRDVHLRDVFSGFPLREKYQELPKLQRETDLITQTRKPTERRNYQSRNSFSGRHRGLSRFQQNYERFRQIQSENKQYSRLVRNQEISEGRSENLYERRTVRNLHYLRTRSLTRTSDLKHANINARAISSITVDALREANIKAFQDNGLDMGDLRDKSSIEKYRKIDLRKRNGLEQREHHLSHRQERETVSQSIKDSDKQTERITVQTRQAERESMTRRENRNHQLNEHTVSLSARSLSDSQTSIRPINIAARRKREVRNEHTDRRVLSSSQRSTRRIIDLTLESSIRLSLAHKKPRPILTMERDITVRRESNIVSKRRSGHFRQRSNDISLRSSRSLELLTITNNRELTDRVQNDHRATRVELTPTTQRNAQVQKRLGNSIKTNSLSRSDLQRNSIDKFRFVIAINTVETRESQSKERDIRLNRSQRLTNKGSSLREAEKNVLRRTNEAEKIHSNEASNLVRFRQQPSDVRQPSSSRSERSSYRSERSRSTERLKVSFARDLSKRESDMRISERRDQRTSYEESKSRSNFDMHQVRISRTRDNRILHNLERNVERMDLRKDNNVIPSKIGRLIVNQGDKRESRLTRSENVERNNILREHSLNFERSRNLLNSNLNDEQNHAMLNWQAAFYALQAIYICSIIFKSLNKADFTKKKTWSYSWFGVPINKID